MAGRFACVVCLAELAPRRIIAVPKHFSDGVNYVCEPCVSLAVNERYGL
jgi:hypothetical protein